eukprot:1085910-Pyramimonas_sp.AAC.1
MPGYSGQGNHYYSVVYASWLLFYPNNRRSVMLAARNIGEELQGRLSRRDTTVTLNAGPPPF